MNKQHKTLEDIREKYGDFEQRYASKMREKSALEIYEETKKNKVQKWKYQQQSKS